jgi:lysozyme
MNVSKNGIDLIKRFEGCRLEAYKCPAGVWTIGYGHTAGVKQGDKITREQAETYLKKDLYIRCIQVSKLIKVPVTQNQFDALISLEYNIGLTYFKSSTLLRLLNEGKYNDAAAQFDKWVYANRIKLRGLVKRRQAEKILFLAN